MTKSRDAFRTISEVADWLDTPAHVLRFWESKFSQVKPVKRAGGRRYYRPADMALIGGIKRLLHDDGMTIKGVQKILREQGVKHVTALSQPLDGGLVAEPPAAKTAAEAPVELDVDPAEETAEVLAFTPAPRARKSKAKPAKAPPPEEVPATSGADAPGAAEAAPDDDAPELPFEAEAPPQSAPTEEAEPEQAELEQAEPAQADLPAFLRPAPKADSDAPTAETLAPHAHSNALDKVQRVTSLTPEQAAKVREDLSKLRKWRDRMRAARRD